MSDQSSDGPRIVVGVDGSATSLAALRWAVRQAELTGARVEALATWTFPYSTGFGGAVADFDLAGATQQALDDTLAQVPTDVPVTGRVTEGPAAPLLLEAARTADLLVVGSRGHGAFTGMLLGSVSQHCVSHADCPVVVVRGEPAAHTTTAGGPR